MSPFRSWYSELKNCIPHFPPFILQSIFVIQAENPFISRPDCSAITTAARCPTALQLFYTKSRRVNLVAGVLGNEGNTLLDVLLEVTNAGVEETLLSGIDLANGENLLDTVGAELDLGGEELDALVLVEGRLDKAMAMEAAAAKERYMKLQAEGKTDQAKADLARLKLIREQRAAEAERRQAEKEEKEAQDKARKAEIEAREKKLREAAAAPKKGKKK
ncbi:hypothetical protein NLG97_g10525 [Lecanicillium saksenae]|uniref:Uncharacterized protein n=1 Tax=Lecanicillium saksenae TaxID=468837 RepID=A0ACC1QGS7_9HYPO|nr:hypothetical protein NLG97_g10525 [Lecanicillium saksenae]